MTAVASLEAAGIQVPHGRSGNVKVTCPKCSHTRRREHVRERCLWVDVDEGVWKCFNCGWTGSVKGSGDNYGSPLGRRETPRVWTKPEPIPAPNLNAKAQEFFTSRGISMAVVERNRITVGEDAGLKFPYFRGGELVNVKTRYPGKKFRMESGAELIFCGLDDCATSEQVVIVEGEMDKLAIETAGIKAVLSVPNGANTGEMTYLASGEETFDRCHTIIIAVDNDQPGQILESELARRIGKEKCFRASWPEGCKDANDVLIKHGAEKLRECLSDARPYPIAGIINPKDVFDDYMLAYDRGIDGGLSTGWASLDNGYTVKTGQLTIVGGMPGSGKSEVLDALMVNMARLHDWRFAVYSPENFPPETHLRKWAKKIVGKTFFGSMRMTREEAAEALEWSAQHLDFLMPEDESSLDTVLGLARALVYRYGIKGLVIDPWNNMDHDRPNGTSETEYISQSLTKIRQFARIFDVHVWVLAHPMKMQKDKDGSYGVPSPYDISGSANWYNKADNIFTVFRNKTDKFALVEIHIQKIRFHECGELGVCGLRYSPDSGRYIDAGEWTPAGGKG